VYASVIVAVDPGTPPAAALATGRSLASVIGCPLSIVHVATPGADDHHGWLESLAVGPGPTCTTTVLAGDNAADALLELQASKPDALLCLATSARTGIAEIALGSTASEIVRRIDHPVVLVGPNAQASTSIERIQVCLDGSDDAAAAADTAAVWALLLRAQLHLVRVAPPSTRDDPHDSVADLAALAHELRTSIAVRPEWEVLHDDHPADALVAYAASLPASLIVMTTRGRADVVGRVLGSTGMRVVRDATCPVLLVHHLPDERRARCS
jgi:nucleotide-binding universal stress UspA family protein